MIQKIFSIELTVDMATRVPLPISPKAFSRLPHIPDDALTLEIHFFKNVNWHIGQTTDHWILIPHRWAKNSTKHHYYPTVYIQSNCLFFAMSWVTDLFHRSINLTIDWHYTMAWLPTSLLKTHRSLSTCATKMHVRFIYERRRYAPMVKIRHGLATLNSNNCCLWSET